MDLKSPSLPSSTTGRRRYRLTRRGKVVFTLLPLLAVVGPLAVILSGEAPRLMVEAPADGSQLGPDQVEGGIVVTATADVPLEASRFQLEWNGEELDPEPVEDGVRATVAAPPDGEHRLVVRLDRGFPHGTTEETRQFSVDTAPPGIELLGPLDPVPVGEPVTVRGQVDDPSAAVTVNGTPVEVAADGTFEQSFPEPPKAAVLVAAADPVGNTSESALSVELALPGSPGGPPMHGVHATGWTWATPELRDPIIEMIRQGKINTVQLDLKDEAGMIWYDTGVELAHEVGAVQVLYDLPQVVEELHDLGVRVVGRLVVFRDPLLAAHAVEASQMDLVVQNPDGTAYGKYGGFTNPYNEQVWDYNIAVGEEAARLGVDDILYDYVRRPDDYLERMRFPGQDRSPEQAIVDFLATSHERIGGAGARLGASVFGIAATRPTEIAQDIPAMAEHVDYIAPMVYPSHWGPGEYGVADPNSQPYDIVYRSMLDFAEQLEGTGAGLVAWLQDFSLGVDYGPAEVRAQIQAAADAGVPDFLLWDPATTYTWAALD